MHERSRRPGGPGVGAASSDLPARPGKVGASTRVQTELPYRAQMERAFGQDFSSVRVTTGQTHELDAIGATAAAKGETVAFADATPTPWLVAHELAHVVQHRRGGAA